MLTYVCDNTNRKKPQEKEIFRLIASKINEVKDFGKLGIDYSNM